MLKLIMPRHIEAQALNATQQNLTVIHKNSLWRQRNALSCHNKHSLPLSYTASEPKPSPHKINNNPTAPNGKPETHSLTSQQPTAKFNVPTSSLVSHTTSFLSCLDLIRTSQSVCSFVRNGIFHRPSTRIRTRESKTSQDLQP